MAIAEQELVEPAKCLPRDALPSELVRGWPEEKWCKGAPRQFGEDGAVRYCAIGILCYFGGYDDPHWSTNPAAQFVSGTYGIPREVVMGAIGASDGRGKDAAADWLEAAGF